MEIFSRKEIKVLGLSILILAIVFGLNDKRISFNLDYWLLNFIKVIIVVAVSLVFRELIRKLIAYKYGCETELKIWSFQRYGVSAGAKIDGKLFGIKIIDRIWAGILFPILVSLISLGRAYFPAVNTTEIIEDYNKRAGREFIRLTGRENAIINLSAAFASLFLALVGVVFNLNQFVTINFWICLFSFLPLGDLDGTKTLFGSGFLYAFGLSFSVLAFILVNLVTVWDTVVISLIGSGLVLIFLLYYVVKDIK